MVKKTSVLSFLKPDLVLTLSHVSEITFKKLGMKTRFFPVMINTKKFAPVDYLHKKKIRMKYGIDEKLFVILHVGSIRKNRGLETLTKILENKDSCILIVGSTSMPSELDVLNKLKSCGCTVWLQYFPHIEEIYQLSDLYIFPVTNNLGSIELPLSVLEAMACNLPIITTKFGALPDLFKEGDGLFFVESADEITQKIKQIKTTRLIIKTREKVIDLSLENICKRIDPIFQSLLREEAI
jgi:glycosyltransferase involved in cell wall biosynthesis